MLSKYFACVAQIATRHDMSTARALFLKRTHGQMHTARQRSSYFPFSSAHCPQGPSIFSITITLDDRFDNEVGNASDATDAFFGRLTEEGGTMLRRRFTPETESYSPAVPATPRKASPGRRVSFDPRRHTAFKKNREKGCKRRQKLCVVGRRCFPLASWGQAENHSTPLR